RNSVPAPRIDFQPQHSERFYARIRLDSLLVFVATELPPDDVSCIEIADGLQDLDLFIADRFAVGSRGSFNGQVGKDLKEVVLNDIADRACLVVERAATLDTEVLSHGDLHALNVIAVPERLKEIVCEPEEDEILDRSFSEIMIDAEDMLFVETREQRLV